MTPWNWKRSLASALLYALAFNLVFFIQELFLVLPKAFTPGLRPTLFHNNHTWEGNNPLAKLFQGTGALATFITALLCAVLLRRGWGQSSTARLFLIWMAYNGFFQSLPQVVLGAFIPANDVGMAMDYFSLSAPIKTAAAIAALVAMPITAILLTRPLLALADTPGEIAGGAARAGFVLRMATLPSVIAIGLIIPFRVPREWIEVVMVPLVVTVIGVVWMQAGAWFVTDVKARGQVGAVPIARLAGALVVLLLVFQLVLRRGVHFY
ncbi:MAG: hypothetical protein JSR66_21670 [Proteobacteria bacterium]|nr:hypothetical protein [Pseudomonadota bacterium]